MFVHLLLAYCSQIDSTPDIRLAVTNVLTALATFTRLEAFHHSIYTGKRSSVHDVRGPFRECMY